MPGDKLEKVMTGFIEGAFDVLVSTTIVESGLDIPNANTIIINQASKYGLSELHQMRGRVGRSNRKAFCYLLAPPDISLSNDARKRLKAMEEFSDLGSGFHIALRDLDIRGAGDLLGAEQTGFISDVGYDLYHKILDEAVFELKEEHFSELFHEEIKARKSIIVEDCQVDLDLDIRIPDNYLPSTTERLTFYRRIANADNEAELRKIQLEMIDRFGTMPSQVLGLFDVTRIRETGKRLGLERVVLRTGVLRLYFVGDKASPFFSSDAFGRVILYVQHFPAKVKMKESPKYLSLTLKNITHIKEVVSSLDSLLAFVRQDSDQTEDSGPDPVPNPN
jgi:transcription-repair coupling factor (superfamily II helicase)